MAPIWRCARPRAADGRSLTNGSAGEPSSRVWKNTTLSFTFSRSATAPFMFLLLSFFIALKSTAISNKRPAIKLRIQCCCSLSFPALASIFCDFFFAVCGASHSIGREILRTPVKSFPADGVCCCQRPSEQPCASFATGRQGRIEGMAALRGFANWIQNQFRRRLSRINLQPS